MKNNLFYYATGELTQDAILCYCANAFNDESHPELREMAVKFIQLLLNGRAGSDIQISSVDVVRQFSKAVTVNKEKITVKIDVLLIVNGNIAVILEDKTYSGHHDDQITRYREGLDALKKEGLTVPLRKDYVSSPEEKSFRIDKIICVYYKTGEYYPSDEKIERRSDVVCIHRKDMLDLLAGYTKYSEILEQYYTTLSELDRWYKEIEFMYRSEKYETALNESYGQLVCARDFFHGKMAEPYQEKDIIIETGSSYGRPYTWIWLWGETGRYWFGYRIDRDSNGCCISFRQYKWHAKTENTDCIREKKAAIHAFFRQYFINNLERTALCRYKLGSEPGTHYENPIITFYFKDYESPWSEFKDNLQQVAEAAILAWRNSGKG